MKNLILVIGLIGGLIGCGGNSKNGIEKYRGEMESYIDSVSDDFGSYEFVEMGTDTCFMSDLYWSYIDSNLNSDSKRESVFDVYKGLYYSGYKHYMDLYYDCFNFYGDDDECDIQKSEFIDFKEKYDYCRQQLDNIQSGKCIDTISEIYYYINYKIRNNNNAIVKRNCIRTYQTEYQKWSNTNKEGYYRSWYKE